MPELPDVLIPVVLACLDTRNSASLLSCSLVNRTWAWFAQRMLFHAPSFPSSNRSKAHLEQFVATIVDLRSRDSNLPCHVRALRIVIGRPNGAGPHLDIVDLRTVALAVSICPSLELFHISQTRGDPLLFKPEELLLLRTAQNVHRLEYYVSNNHSALLFQLMDAWPRLASLRVVFFPVAPWDFAHPCVLRELQSEWWIHGAFKQHVTTAPLARLVVDVIEDPRELLPFRATLRTLVFGLPFSIRVSGADFAVLGELERLEHVLLTFASEPHIVTLLDALPDGVTIFGFAPGNIPGVSHGAGNEESLQRVVDALARRPRVQTLGLINVFRPGSPRPRRGRHVATTNSTPGLERVLEFCALRPIAVKYVVESELYESWPRD